jgi:NAD(P)-dependent dehydrogenase (short-subunit alcohol dehydrogenase family)
MRSCVVTGAAAGIGRSTVIRLVRDGWAVAAVDVDAAGLTALAEEHHAVAPIEGDVGSRKTSVRAAEAAASLGELSGWVNNAGIYIAGGAHDIGEQDLRRQIDVNLTGVLWGCAEAIRRFLPRRSGAIASTSSIQAIAAFPKAVVYAATKGGINAMTRQIAVEYGPFGIRANAVMPGAIRTPMTVGGWQAEGDPAAAERSDALLHPLRRVGEPEDVAALISFLLSDDASFITGQCMAVDGGASARCYAYDADEELARAFGIQGVEP